mmetsp:Transcript_1340/g.4555  ORF Transcript_1340/g.4555 Transcript_1340/m.4555 type:complete len:201 (-) Transcript_1340:937-1539(-)
MFDGGVLVLWIRSPFRTFLTAHIFVKRISVIFALNSDMALSYSRVSSRFCSSFSFISSVSALMCEMAAARASMCFVFASPITVSCSFVFFFSRSNSCWFCAILAVSSSTWSLKAPHSRDMRSCRRPQFSLPSTHFFHCPPGAGPSCTGTTAAAATGAGVVVVLLVSRVDTWCCARLSSPEACPRASRNASRASGVIIFST